MLAGLFKGWVIPLNGNERNFTLVLFLANGSIILIDIPEWIKIIIL